jgi:hypothetical protein
MNPINESFFYKFRNFVRIWRKNGGTSFENKLSGQRGPKGETISHSNTGGIFGNIVRFGRKMKRGRRRNIFG